MNARFGFEDRAPEVPPADSLAEAMVLLGMLEEPERLSQDLSGLLVFPEHRQVLGAMQRARQRTAGESYPCFYLAYLEECALVDERLVNVLRWQQVDREHSRWVDTRLADTEPGDPRRRPVHDWEWWLERLKKVAAARRLVANAQQIAERAWRGDIDGALEVADRIERKRDVIRIDV